MKQHWLMIKSIVHLRELDKLLAPMHAAQQNKEHTKRTQ